MTTVFGLPAVEVEQPDGEVVRYVCTAVPAEKREWRAWRVTGPEGQSYRVSEYPSGRWRCECKAFLFRGRRGASECKHISAVRRELEATDARTPPAPR
jgi:hypothetical protein